MTACDNVAKVQQDKIRQQKEEIDHLKNHVKSLGSKMKEMDENISKLMTIHFKNLETNPKLFRPRRKQQPLEQLFIYIKI